MKKIVIASTQPSAGKTSMIVGLAKAMGGNVGYLKPLGDRLLYKKKRQWDYDASAVTTLLGLREDPESMTIGFEHSKLRFMYDDEGIKEKLAEALAVVDGEKDVVFYECGRTLTYGISVNLDAVALAKDVRGKLIAVVSGSDDVIIDDAVFAQRYMEGAGVDFGGIIINKVRDKADFEETHRATVEESGVKVLGVVPFREELMRIAVSYLADKLFAKVIAGEAGLGGTIEHIVVGAMSASTALRAPVFGSENKLVITGGDRSDMILAALETKSAAVVLTNNILPPANLISKASELGIPLLSVRPDTFEIAKQVDEMEPLMVKEDTARAAFLADLVKEHLDLKAIV